MPFPRASTLHSFAIDGEPGTKPSASVANIRGGSQAVTAEPSSMPGPKFNFTATDFPLPGLTFSADAALPMPDELLPTRGRRARMAHDCERWPRRSGARPPDDRAWTGPPG